MVEEGAEEEETREEVVAVVVEVVVVDLTEIIVDREDEAEVLHTLV